jgi:hypothetical protein
MPLARLARLAFRSNVDGRSITNAPCKLGGRFGTLVQEFRICCSADNWTNRLGRVEVRFKRRMTSPDSVPYGDFAIGESLDYLRF